MPTPPTLDQIIAFGGQSNISGRTPTSGAPAHGNLSNAWLLKPDGNWQNPPVDPANDPTNGLYNAIKDTGALVGPILYFADRWLRFHPTQKIGLVPCAKGGIPIADFARSTNTNTVYGASKAMWETAAPFGTASKITGMCFFQGEADCETTTERDAWYAAFQQLVTDWRSDMGAGLPVVANILGPFDASRQITSPYGDDVRLIQSRINIPRVATVQNYDATLYDDVHLDAASAQRCGFRMADAMRLLGA